MESRLRAQPGDTGAAMLLSDALLRLSRAALIRAASVHHEKGH
jgi:hypothetical protein